MNKKILIVEDDQGVLEMMKTVLAEAGFSITTCDQGVRALDTTISSNPDLILLDIWMGDKDGPEILKDLRSLPETSRIPIVMVSATSQTRKIALDSGADGFLEKPFNIEELVAISQKHLK